MIRTIVPRFYHQTRLNICKRFCHTKSSDLADRIENVRVRFAPSPTGSYLIKKKGEIILKTKKKYLITFI